MQFSTPPSDTTTAVTDSTLGITAQDVAQAANAVISPEFWLGVGMTALRVGLTIALALLAIGVVTRIKKRWVASVQDDPATDKRRQRVLTTSDLLGSVARYVIWAITIVTVLAMIGFDVRALLAGAGIAGLAIGFWSSHDEVKNRWRSSGTFEPTLSEADRLAARQRWSAMVTRVRSP